MNKKYIAFKIILLSFFLAGCCVANTLAIRPVRKIPNQKQ